MIRAERQGDLRNAWIAFRGTAEFHERACIGPRSGQSRAFVGGKNNGEHQQADQNRVDDSHFFTTYEST